jgi:hypothetical protein
MRTQSGAAGKIEKLCLGCLVTCQGALFFGGRELLCGVV